MANEDGNNTAGDALKSASHFVPPTWKIGCAMAFVLIVVALLFFTTGLSSPGVEEADAKGTGGAAAGPCMQVENGSALSSDELNKLIDKIPNASILKGTGALLYDNGVESNINPLLTMAQARHESQFGQAYRKISGSKYGMGHNMFGMDYSPKYLKKYLENPPWVFGGESGKHKVTQWKKWEYGMIEHPRLLRRAYLSPGGYVEKSRLNTGHKKVAELTDKQKVMYLIDKYAPSSDGNKPEKYADAVLGYMEDWCKTMGKL